MKFEEWMKKVDAELIRKCGLDSRDLPDCMYVDWHEEGCTPKRAAARAFRNADE